MRAGRPDAAIYYLARMVEAGEDPKFIARRMVIFASEDVGLAQPTALVVANAVFEAVRSIGYRKQRLTSRTASPISHNAKRPPGVRCDFEALDDVKKFGNLPIPLKIRNAPTKLMKDLKYGKGYEGV